MTNEQFIKEIAKYVQKYAPQFGIKVCSAVERAERMYALTATGSP